MVAPLLLAGLAALTFGYFLAGLALYVLGTKRERDATAGAGRNLARTAIAPAVAAAGSILLPRLLGGLFGAVLIPFGLAALGLCVLGPPAAALAGALDAKKNDA